MPSEASGNRSTWKLLMLELLRRRHHLETVLRLERGQALQTLLFRVNVVVATFFFLAAAFFDFNERRT